MNKYIFFIKFENFSGDVKDLNNMFESLEFKYSLENDEESQSKIINDIYLMINSEYISENDLDCKLNSVLNCLTEGFSSSNLEKKIAISIYINIYFQGINFSWTFLTPDIIQLIGSLGATVELEFYEDSIIK